MNYAEIKEYDIANGQCAYDAFCERMRHHCKIV